jgi:uncharacterized protein YceH (UPF0502 family)
MLPILSASEQRVLGALIEKAITTPEYYPLTLNALVNACNQKSNRDPIVAYDEATVLGAVDGLREHGLIRVLTGERVAKYRQYFQEAVAVTPAQEAILCELLLRGPQTIGELRGRCERLYSFPDLATVEMTLAELLDREEPLVIRLPRQSGRKESRFAHALGELPVSECVEGGSEAPVSAVRGERARLEALEAEVASLRETLAGLQAQFDAFRQQFE